MRFYLGTHETSWLAKAGVRLFISHRRLAKRLGPRARLPNAIAPWALDSGGFTELSTYGAWRTPEAAYVEAVHRYRDEIGLLEWAAPQDWMTEPAILAETGLTVRDHQELTIESYLRLRDQGPFVPVLQGWTLRDYETCLELYRDHGVDLASESIVGVGSVCRRQSEDEIGRIMAMLIDAGIRPHGFGVKKSGLRKYKRELASADSMAWSFRARRDDPMPGHTHAHCANCLEYALRWREQVLGIQSSLWGSAPGHFATLPAVPASDPE